MLFQVSVTRITFLLCVFLVGLPIQAQMQHADPVEQFLMLENSGTAHDPAAVPRPMLMTDFEGWMVMFHGQAFVNEVSERGAGGEDKFFSTNWIMGMADRKLGGGHLLLRSMLSLEPLTIGKRGYPERFQTGEGLIDRQHPHDFVMELAGEYAVELAPGTIGYVYAAPVGDPALGPVAFPHRASAAEIPQAPLSHHLQDSTHIASSVLTIGVQQGELGLGVSGFHGREPDQDRWDIDRGPLDSWAVRATWDPTPNVSAQVSTGNLRNPEPEEPGNVQRTTASLSVSRAGWSSSAIWGWNHRSNGNTNGFLVESVYRFNVSNALTARLEIARKEEFANTIKALTAGYTKDILRTDEILGGVGGNVTVYDGASPSYFLFVRVRNH